ncbi:hypothetical protein DSO57_1035468 [Entomophthora muscae]|uniref:Uncharacterized protein n=1 Tax=Entomophthora muscae TaxID=34485 RepID=A0ACC2TAM7_9FUNG|nr:hypothetical protein DSO57_1035468 [Entomophthora muscae]
MISCTINSSKPNKATITSRPSSRPSPQKINPVVWNPPPQPVKNENLDAPKSQNTESESNPGQNPSRTARLIGWEHNNPLLIDEVAASPPGPKPLAALQDSASKLPVQDAGNFPEVPTPDTSGLPGEIDKFLPENYSELLQSPREGTEPKEALNT